MLRGLLNFFTSLRLTVVLLLLALILVFVGTIAQVKLGLYAAQSEYFRSLFIYWKPQEASFKIPIFPGGWLLGGLLLVNLLAAHIKRFKFSKKKIGIFLTHFGLILLLLGQFLTEVFQVESTLRLAEGETRNYTEDSFNNELVIIDTTRPEKDEVVSIPVALVMQKGEIKHPALPFTLRIKDYYPNSEPTGPMTGGDQKIKTTEGIGSRLAFAPVATTTVMDDENKPTAWVEIVGDQGVIGDWAATVWLTRYPWPENLRARAGTLLDDGWDQPQSFTYKDRTYEIALRPIRYYKPYKVTLLDFTHDKYPGTEIPKNFSSKVHLSYPDRNEERDVLIYMNNPLRYEGKTFFQSGFMRGDTGTILQVVDNPAAITPYLSCTLVGLGLTIQFLMGLASFARKNKTHPDASSPAALSENVKSSLATTTAERSVA